MVRRKIQLIAGTTYSVSLPKEWVIKNNLKEGNEVDLKESGDKTITVSAGTEEVTRLTSYSLDVDKYGKDVYPLIFALYHLGVDEIEFYSKNELSDHLKSKIRKALFRMSGAEISHEDRQRLVVKVLLDNTKVDLIQVLYRMSLILELSVNNLLEEMNEKSLYLNENEVDRLYLLATKVITMSLNSTAMLQSSGIRNINFIAEYLLLAKRLERIGDVLECLATMPNFKRSAKYAKPALNFITVELTRCMRHLMKPDNAETFSEVSRDLVKKIDEKVWDMPDKAVARQISDALRYLVDIDEAVVKISFYDELARQRLI